jgi:hypothetical protein
MATPSINTDITTTHTNSYQGRLRNIPVAILERMLDRQEQAGNPRDITVFERDIYAGTADGGFDWEGTPEMYDYWNCVVIQAFGESVAVDL